MKERERNLNNSISRQNEAFYPELKEALLDLIGKTEMEKTLGITDPVESEYLVVTMAWNLHKKIKPEIDFLSRSGWMDVFERQNIITKFFTKTVNSYIELKEEISTEFLNKKNQILQENPSIESIANVIDRMSNFLSIYFTQAKEEKILNRLEIIEGSKKIIKEYCNEMFIARNTKRTNL